MKKILFASAILFSTVTYAQKVDIQLENGKTLKIKSEMKQNMTMSMGMEIKSESETKYSAKITKADANGYEVVGQTDKLKVKAEAMGQDQSYDSDIPTDKDSELGKLLSDLVGKQGTYGINRSNGAVTVIKAPAIDTSKLAAGAGGIDPDMMPTLDVVIKNAFLTSIAGKKAGDKWTDSSTTNDGLKNIYNYNLVSITGNTANLAVTGTTRGKMTRETQGMQIEMDMNSENTGNMEVDTKSYLVKKSKTSSKINSKMSVMGQTMDLTGTAEVESKIDVE